MLNLLICRLCHEEYNGVVKQWSLAEEESARRTRYLPCPYGFQGYYEATTYLDGPPPIFCPFAVEQIMGATV